MTEEYEEPPRKQTTIELSPSKQGRSRDPTGQWVDRTGQDRCVCVCVCVRATNLRGGGLQNGDEFQCLLDCIAYLWVALEAWNGWQCNRNNVMMSVGVEEL